MSQTIALSTVLVRNYDEAISFYVDVLGFTLIEDTELSSTSDATRTKRWVVVAPAACADGEQRSSAGLLLAEASNQSQRERIGTQCGDRVALFLHTDDFWRDYERYRSLGVEFVRGEPRVEAYGTVAVFKDVCGNLWDLIEPSA